MSTNAILDGKRVAQEMRADTALLVKELVARGITPGLAVVLVGEDPASQVYVGSKTAAAREAGIRETTLRFQADLPEADLLATLDRLNADPEVDAVLVQLPLPKHLNAARVLERIDPAKDVDGFHPLNVGRLVQGKSTLAPCTPAGVMELLRREGIDPKGMRAVIVGRSDIVGKPMASLLLHAHATVTIAHSRTRDLPAVCREADLLVAAMGKPGFVTGEFVKEGAVVIDVGINRIDRKEDMERFFPGNAARAAAFAKNGSTLVGDCDPATAYPKASRYTPVPGGVGPLTIAQLLANTVMLCRARRGA